MGPALRHGHGLVLYQLRLEHVQLRTKAMNARAVDSVGTETHQILLMENTKLKLEIQILLMKYRNLMSKEIEEAFDNLHDEIPSDE